MARDPAAASTARARVLACLVAGACTLGPVPGAGAFGPAPGEPAVECATCLDCPDATHVTIPPDAVSVGASAFRGCVNLTHVLIPEGVASIGDYAFSYSARLVRVTIPSSVVSIGAFAFRGCGALAAVALPPGVRSIGHHAFDQCHSEQSFYFSPWHPLAEVVDSSTTRRTPISLVSPMPRCRVTIGPGGRRGLTRRARTGP